MGCSLGGKVGYRTRHDSRCGTGTRLVFLTEGLMLRMFQDEDSLADVGAVILDEFHERSLDADLLLALARKLQETRRPDLKLIVMSATLDVEAVSGYLSAPALECTARTFPVEVRYWKDEQPPRKPWDLAAAALAGIFRREEEGDVLIFMPGAYEIRRTIEACGALSTPGPVGFLPLYGDLPEAEQDRAVAPSRTRKVIVSTNVAETSITIEGVRHVIDSGLVRSQHFDSRRGLNVLSVRRTSVGSAEQRAGRPGRTAPGRCVRLWSAWDHKSRAEHDLPEVKRLDLAAAVLFLKSCGVAAPESLVWLDPPDGAKVGAALSLLHRLGATRPDGTLARTGTAMARLPMHPRLSRMVVEGVRRNCADEVCLRAALISERNILIRDAKRSFADLSDEEYNSDFVLLSAALDYASSSRFDRQACRRKGLHAGAARRVDQTRRLYRKLSRRLESQGEPGSSQPATLSLLAAFPDQVAARRSPTSPAYDLVGQRSGQLARDCAARGAAVVVAAEVTEVGSGGSMKLTLSLAEPVEPEWLAELFPDRMESRDELRWDADQRAVEQVREELYDGIPILTERGPADKDDRAAAMLAQRIHAEECTLKKWDDKVEAWLDRVRCVAEWFPERGLLTYDDDDRLVILQEICSDANRFSQVVNRPCLDHVRNALSWADQQFVKKMAPERIQLPRGWRMRVTYKPGERPRGKAKIQDLYDVNETPAVAGGRQPLLLEILGPNFRPVQTTDDLAGFWANWYPKLKNQLQRRYPKHEWR